MEGAFCCTEPGSYDKIATITNKLLLSPIKQISRDRKNQIGTDDLSEKSLW